MPDEPKQEGYRRSADHAAVRALQNLSDPELSEALSLGSIAVSLVRIGDLLERQLALQPWGPPLVGVQEASPREEEKEWYIGEDSRGPCFLTKDKTIITYNRIATYGPFTEEEVDKRLDQMGIG